MAALVPLLLYLILIAPVNLSADIRHDQSTDVSVRWRVWGLGGTLRFQSQLDRKGRHITLLPHKPLGKPRQAPEENVRQGMILLGAFLRSDKARRFLMGHIHLIKLHAAVNVAMSDASQTAVVSGLINGIVGMIPCRYRRRIILRVMPDFFHDHTTAGVRCILFFHLGTILITAAMMLAALALEAREHRQTQAEEA